MVRETEISTQFGFEIKELIPKRGVYLAKTDKGNKCLKKVNYGPHKLMYIYKAKEHIINNGFPWIDKNELSLNGVPYAFVNDDIYVVTEWIDGRECDFRDEKDLETAAKTLARFHLSARNFVPEDNLKARNDIGKLPYTFEKRLSTLNKMRDLARKNKKKTEFDMLYLENVDFYIDLAKRAIKILDLEAYNRVCQKDLQDKVLCHHDFTYHNILIKENGEVYIVDFDYCKEEIQVYDLSTLMVKALKRVDWDVEKGRLIVESYNLIKPLTKDEMNVLKALLTFPQRFWRVANRYYYKEPGWNEQSFTKKIKEILAEKENYMNFIESF
ncbi:spore coat protein, CotS family [Caloramator fervidus]|uniref:Spore coat protein, CotS family n=1 Tax=Caloramator fervidus TaxID=29344 RepID=A0A1H5RJZ5_9CLOT|nr:CotS family spore coat protein [Caloramator fervidus]SEF38676.1 spore coat protein, CotS family [Caloramator fervidus]